MCTKFILSVSQVTEDRQYYNNAAFNANLRKSVEPGQYEELDLHLPVNLNKYWVQEPYNMILFIFKTHLLFSCEQRLLWHGVHSIDIDKEFVKFKIKL